MSAMLERSLSKAKKLEAASDLKGALDLLEGVVKKFPQNPRVIAHRDSTRLKLLRKTAGLNPPDDVQKKLKSLFDAAKWPELLKATSLLIDVHPNSTLLMNMLGIAHLELGNFDASEREHRKALARNFNLAGTHINLGNALQAQGKILEAIECYKISISKDPNIAEAYNNLANCLNVFGNYDEVENYYQNAVKKNPNYSDAKYNLGGIKLLKGEFKEGWGLREYRWDRPDFKPHIERFSEPQWNGQKTNTLFIWSEQGIGDEVMFASGLGELSAYAEQLVVSVDKRSIGLFQRSFPNINFVDRNASIHDVKFDHHVSAMTAVGLLRPNLEAFSSTPHNYIKACDKRETKIRQKLEAEADGRPIIGVSWFTNAKVGAVLRSLSIIDLINQLPEDAYVVNLQYGDVEPDRKKLNRYTGKDLFVDTGVDNKNDIDGLCALISACDRVVSVDNATVHFAGALGKKCDVLLPFTGDWRWGMNWRQNSYWYPSLNLHRQIEPWDWSSALSSLKLALEKK